MDDEKPERGGGVKDIFLLIEREKRKRSQGPIS